MVSKEDELEKIHRGEIDDAVFTSQVRKASQNQNSATVAQQSKPEDFAVESTPEGSDFCVIPRVTTEASVALK